ncbi:hypothetical protein OIU93_07140 [Paeniglutamicibacter sp. ZC-3]|nr:hypothetical protein [Paeniglutamicibacter sp. ZC-3]MCV9994074.1 hypothetical protein [Paeniglutamicibacter sp. ZC-3]
MKTIQTQLKHWAEKAKQEYPSQLEASVRHAVDRMDPAGLARASEEVVATVTGNRKTARRARKAVEESLRKAQRKAGSKHNGHGRLLAVLGTLAVTGILVVIVLRRAAGPHDRNLGAVKLHVDDTTEGIDPDLGE